MKFLLIFTPFLTFSSKYDANKLDQQNIEMFKKQLIINEYTYEYGKLYDWWICMNSLFSKCLKYIVLFIAEYFPSFP